MKGVFAMVGSGGYVVPIKLPLIATKPLNLNMSKKNKKFREFVSSSQLEIFTDAKTGELCSRLTDRTTGKVTIRKCERVNED